MPHADRRRAREQHGGGLEVVEALAVSSAVGIWLMSTGTPTWLMSTPAWRARQEAHLLGEQAPHRTSSHVGGIGTLAPGRTVSCSAPLEDVSRSKASDRPYGCGAMHMHMSGPYVRSLLGAS
jgi:hypothetical protein